MSSTDIDVNENSRGPGEHRDSADSSASINQHLLMVASLYDEIEQQRKSSISFDKIKQISLTYSLQSEDEPGSVSLEPQRADSGRSSEFPLSYLAFEGTDAVVSDRKSSVTHQKALQECSGATNTPVSREKVISMYSDQEHNALRYNSLGSHYSNEDRALEFSSTPINSCTPTRKSRISAQSNCSIIHSDGSNRDFEPQTRYKQVDNDAAPIIGIKLGQHQVSLTFNQHTVETHDKHMPTRFRRDENVQQACGCHLKNRYNESEIVLGGRNNQIWRASPNRAENAGNESILATNRHNSPVDKLVENNEQLANKAGNFVRSACGTTGQGYCKSTTHQTTDRPLNQDSYTDRKRPMEEVDSQEYSRQVERHSSLSPGSRLSGLIEELSLNLNGSGGGATVTATGPQLDYIDHSLASGSYCSSGKQRPYALSEEQFYRDGQDMPICNGAIMANGARQRAGSVRSPAVNPWEQASNQSNDNVACHRCASTCATAHKLARSSPCTPVRCMASNCCSRRSRKYMDDDHEDDEEREQEEENEHNYDEYPARIDIVIKSPQRQVRGCQHEQFEQLSKMSPLRSPSPSLQRQWQVKDQFESSPVQVNTTKSHLMYGVGPASMSSSCSQSGALESWNRHEQELESTRGASASIQYPLYCKNSPLSGCGHGITLNQAAQCNSDYNQISLQLKGKQLPTFNVADRFSPGLVKPSKTETHSETAKGEPASVRQGLHQCEDSHQPEVEGWLAWRATPAAVSESASASAPATAADARAEVKAIKIKDDQLVSAKVTETNCINTPTKELSRSRETQTPAPEPQATPEKKDRPLFAAPK